MIQNIFGQDIITTKDKKNMKVWIIEQTDKLVRFRMPDYDLGPILTIKNNRINKIEYKNGYIDLMGNQNPRKSKPFGVSTGIAYFISDEDGLLLGTMDYFLTPQIDLEVSAGSNMDEKAYFSFGSKIHLNQNYSDNNFTPFAGLLLGVYYDEPFIQVPFGINFISKTGFDASFGMSEVFFFNFNSYWYTSLELRLGWKFKL